MRMIRSSLLLSLALCLFALPLAAEEAPLGTLEEPALVEDADLAPEAALAAPEIDLGPMAEILGSTLAEPRPVPMGFGSHCSGPPSPWACSIVEPGLGCPLGGQCTYSCLCDECVMSDGRIETPAINCTVVDDGGCMFCPM